MERGHAALLFFFFFNDTATTEIYTLSLHDALPISSGGQCPRPRQCRRRLGDPAIGPERADADQSTGRAPALDRKSTRLNSSHQIISYAVFCLKKKKNTTRYRAPATATMSALHWHHC